MKIEDYRSHSGYCFLHPYKLACYQYGLPELELRMDLREEVLGMAIKTGSPQSAVTACCCYYGVAMRAATKYELWTWDGIDNYPMQKAAAEWLKKQLPSGRFPKNSNFCNVIYTKEFENLIERHDFFWMHPDRILKSKKDGFDALFECDSLARKAVELNNSYNNPYMLAIQLALKLNYTDEAAAAFIPSLRLMLSDVEEFDRRHAVKNTQN